MGRERQVLEVPVSHRVMIGRRDFLKAGALALVSLPQSAEAASFVMKRFLALPPKATPFITPNADFYIVNYSKPPHINAGDWSLSIAGRVARPLHLTYRDLLERQAVERMVTLQCIDNEVGGDLIGNALWKGIYLKDLIAESRPSASVENVVMYGADAYFDSISLDRAMHYDVFLAYEMNRERLSTRHGFPLRAVVPGLYGIKNVKWLTKIELVEGDFKGYWQRKGWTENGAMKITSRIDAPGPYNTIKGAATLEGIAFGGYSGVREVEISLDGGKQWNRARIVPTPPSYQPSPYAWVKWRYDWRPKKSGTYPLYVRATDGMGQVQTGFIARAFPEGTSGLHSVVAFAE